MLRIIQILVAIGLTALLIWWADFEEIVAVLIGANYWYCLLALVVITVNRYIMSQKWNMLLRSVGIHISWWECLRIYYVSNFVGLFLPPTIGADMLRATMTAQKRFGLAPIISTILIERLIGLLAIFFFGIVGVLLLVSIVGDHMVEMNELLNYSLFFMFLGMLLLYVSFLDFFSRRVFGLLERLTAVKFIGKVSEKLIKLYRAYLVFRDKKAVMFLFFILTCVETLTVVVMTYVVSLALNANIPFTYFLAIVPIITILIRLPFTIAGFGIHEGGYAYFLSALGFSTTLGLSIGILDHLIIIIGFLPGALFLLFSPKSKQGYQQAIDADASEQLLASAK